MMKLSSTPLVLHTTRALSIPKTNPKLDLNPKTKLFPWNPMGSLGKNENRR